MKFDQHACKMWLLFLILRARMEGSHNFFSTPVPKIMAKQLVCVSAEGRNDSNNLRLCKYTQYPEISWSRMLCLWNR